MIKNYFKTAFRKLWKNKTYAAINIFGLTLGLAACLLIGVYILHELSYDKFNERADRIVRVTMTWGKEGNENSTASTGTKVGPQFKRTFPLVEKYVRTYINHNIIKSEDRIFDEPAILYADEPFFSIFSYRLIQGNAATALDAPDKIVMTASAAKKYFGTDDAINKTLVSGGKELRVSAVCEDVPQNSQLKFDFVTQFANLGNGVDKETWWNANWVTYLLIRDKQSIPLLQPQVNDYTASKAFETDAGLEDNDYLKYTLEPLTRVHLYSPLAGFEPNGSITYIYMFAVIALLILVIACANYTNLATAQSAGRTGEIGMRKVMGASKGQVFMQFMGESATITGIAAVAAFWLSWLLIPYFNNVTGRHFTPEVLLQPAPLICLLLFAVLVSFFAGIYPALILSGTQVISVLKKGFHFTGGNGTLRKTLIVAQFGISVFLIIYTIIILQQMHYMQTKNLGYEKSQVVVMPISRSMYNNLQPIKDAFAGVRGVESVTASYDTPEYVGWTDGITATDEKGKHELAVHAMPVDFDFTKTMKMQLIAGRDFIKSDLAIMDTSNDYANFRQPYIINETLAKKLGWSPQQSLNRIIDKNAPGPIVGVVKDFHFSSLHDAIGPMLIFLGSDYSRKLLLRVEAKDMPATLARLEMTWKQRVSDSPFSYHFLDDDYNKLYLSEQRSAVLFGLAAGLGIILALLGLFGLAAFTTLQRTKEIGIRRVLGADIRSITLLVAKNFLQLVIVSICIASPLAWWAGSRWLQDYAFRIPLQAYVFLATAVVTVVIALATVSYHSIRAALLNPVKSLRTE